MQLSQKFLGFTNLGAEWVLWLLVILSVVSVAIMVERLWFFSIHRVNVDALMASLRKALRTGDWKAARATVDEGDTAEAIVLRAGFDEIERGPDAVGEAMLAQKAQQRVRLERNLAVLGTLGNNTPFIGLFGTVLGIIKASRDMAAMQAQGGQAANAVMAGVFEALIATAIGLMVAIPAVIGYNYFQRRVRATVSNVDALAHVLLAQLRGDDSAVPAKAAAASK
jgi:biopolymer transport protein ExbB